MNIDLAVLGRQYDIHAAEYEEAALRALRSGWYILGPELEAFEREFAAYTGAKYAVGLNSGLDALTLSAAALGIGAGDEVVVPANTYIATALAVTENGASPVFAEPDAYYNLDAAQLEAAITSRTRAIMPVHLYGQAADMPHIMRAAEKYHLAVIEDEAIVHIEGEVVYMVAQHARGGTPGMHHPQGDTVVVGLGHGVLHLYPPVQDASRGGLSRAGHSTDAGGEGLRLGWDLELGAHLGAVAAVGGRDAHTIAWSEAEVGAQQPRGEPCRLRVALLAVDLDADACLQYVAGGALTCARQLQRRVFGGGEERAVELADAGGGDVVERQAALGALGDGELLAAAGPEAE